MRTAIELSLENVQNGGGPFGAVIVKETEIIARGVNRVTDSCEPCPMCLGAIYWARLDKMYYANSKADAKEIGFDDSFIYNEIQLKPTDRRLFSKILLRKEAIKAFEAWTNKGNKVKY